MQYSETLYSMVGRIRHVKPNASPAHCQIWINDVIRMLQDYRSFWSDTMRRGIISLADVVNIGTVTTTLGSNVVTGSGTAWPVSDLVNTTLYQEVRGPGNMDAFPASMAGIGYDTQLLIDYGTPSQEVVAVLAQSPTTFHARFAFPHPAGATITASSLAGRQFRVQHSYPVFGITAVVDPQTIWLELPWGAKGQSGLPYQILTLWISAPAGFKKWIGIVDQVQGVPLDFNQSSNYLDIRDPQRTALGDPECLAFKGPSASGNMQYEIWPGVTTGRQLSTLYCVAWPELRDRNDHPPFFIAPKVITDGATAIALKTKVSEKDPFFDLRLAKEYDAEFEKGKMAAINADDSRALTELQDWLSISGLRGRFGLGMGANFWQSHNLDLMLGNY